MGAGLGANSPPFLVEEKAAAAAAAELETVEKDDMIDCYLNELYYHFVLGKKAIQYFSDSKATFEILHFA
jgi:ribosome assembly protein YihI (activator of Der GTPase)